MPHTITNRSVRRWNVKFESWKVVAPVGNGGHPTKKHTKGRQRHFLPAHVFDQRAAMLRMKYEHLILALYRTANQSHPVRGRSG